MEKPPEMFQTVELTVQIPRPQYLQLATYLLENPGLSPSQAASKAIAAYLNKEGNDT